MRLLGEFKLTNCDDRANLKVGASSVGNEALDTRLSFSYSRQRARRTTGSFLVAQETSEAAIVRRASNEIADADEPARVCFGQEIAEMSARRPHFGCRATS